MRPPGSVAGDALREPEAGFLRRWDVPRAFRRPGSAAAGGFAGGGDGGGAVEDTAMFELAGYREIFRQAGLREHPRGIPTDSPGTVLLEQVILIQEEAFFASRAIAEVGGALAEILAAPVKRRLEFESTQCHGVKTVWCSADVFLDQAAGYAARVSEPGGGDRIEEVVFVERAAEAFGMELLVVADTLGQAAVGDDVGDIEFTAGFQNPVD